MKKFIFILFLFFSIHGMSEEKNFQLWIDSANQFYTAGKYNKAIDNYEKVLKEGMEAAELYFNLGNAYYKSGKIAHAILNYEKAKKFSPADEDILFNLKLVNQLTVDKLDSYPTLFLTDWKNSFLKMFSEKEWAIICIVIFTLFLGLFGLYIVLENRAAKRFSFWLMVSFFILSIFSFFIAQQQYKNMAINKEAIIMASSITIKGSPNENGTKLFILHEGTKASITDIEGDWVEIKLPNGNVGWLPESAVAVI